MSRFICTIIAMSLLFGLRGSAQAADTQTTALLDKAIKAIGGEEALGKIKAASWKTKGTITFNGNDNAVSTEVTIQGLDHYRQVLDGEFNGNKLKVIVVLAGDKGTRHINDMDRELDKQAIANQKRTIYLSMIPVTILPLKSKDFKVEAIADDKVGDKAVAGIKVTCPDEKDFKLYFDKETGLPAKLVATVAGFGQGQPFTQETTFSEYKEVGGIKKATKVISKRDGEKFMEQTIADFKVLEKVEPKLFTEAG